MRLGRVHGIVVAARRARKVSRWTREGPRNDAADAMRPIQQFSRNLAHPVQLGDGNHIFVRGDLKNAVARGVDDGLAGAHMLVAQFLDDFGAGSRLVAESLASDLLFEFSDELRRETLADKPERPGQPDAGHLPMPGGGVFAGRVRGAFSVGCEWRGGGSEMRQAARCCASPSFASVGKRSGRDSAM